MNRLKLLAAVALLGIPLAACEEATPPPPLGSINGQVSIEGTGIDGVSVNLSNGSSTTTAGGGTFRFDNVEGGAYTVTISGYPSDATFDATSAAVTISTAGQSSTVNFSGTYIRTASVMGSVTVENMGLSGVTVALSGTSAQTAVTDGTGQFAFTGLRMGNYSVEISGFDSDEVAFSSTASAVTVGVGESKIVSFDGTYLRTAGIQGRVSVGGEGLEGVTVSLTGGPDATDKTTMTDASGGYSFAQLRAGDYVVGISGYDMEDYGFEVTSRNVTVALGETATVPFDGELLRTAGISGRVSVEGMGLADVAVTLSGAADMETTTDASGSYGFAGLAAGDYNVAISGVDETMYVFDAMDMDVSVMDDEAAIANFDGMHARTASVSGKLYIDEGTMDDEAGAGNDMRDEGEAPFEAPGVPLALVGPGVNDQMPGATNADGEFMFENLKAGTYQLLVLLTPETAAAMMPYGYGGPATGYSLTLAAGEAEVQDVPFDITHQTVGFGVTLRHGEAMGEAVPGATVSLYADMEGAMMVASGMTDEMGMASITFPRGDMANMVYAGVTAPEGAFGMAEGMQMVSWKSPEPATTTMNMMDFVSLKADFTFGAKTIMTDAGGREALADWIYSAKVMADDMTMAADDMAAEPMRLDDMGMATVMHTAASVDDVPVKFALGLDSVQVDADGDPLDGGEKWMLDGADDDGYVMHVHDGLSLPGEMPVDAGMLEVRYTTQSLTVGVHQDRDQIAGYTGSIHGGDARPSAMSASTIRLELMYIDSEDGRTGGRGDGRARAVLDEEGNPIVMHPKNGMATFSGVPSDMNVLVRMSVGDHRTIVSDDEILAYRDLDENNIAMGAFGDQGGFSPHVYACPLTADKAYQDFHGPGDDSPCSTFAYVWLRDVMGNATANEVVRSDTGDGFKKMEGDGAVAKGGVSVSLDPVAGKNLAEEMGGAASTATKAPKLGSYVIPGVADGWYAFATSDGWRSTAEMYRTTVVAAFDESGLGQPVAEGSDDKVEGPAPMTIDVTPSTGTIYGRVTEHGPSDGHPVRGVAVSAGGVTDTTDFFGRYILKDVAASARAVTVMVEKTGYVSAATEEGADDVKVAANMLHEKHVEIRMATPMATVSGKVTDGQTGDPVAGVQVFWRTGDAFEVTQDPKPGNTKFKPALTDADGMYEIDVTAGIRAGQPGTPKQTTIFVDNIRTFFTPNDGSWTTTLVGGQELINVNFTAYDYGTVRGRVVEGTRALAGATVIASNADGVGVDTATTGSTGYYQLYIPPFSQHTITASKFGYSFASSRTVTLAPGQVFDIDDDLLGTKATDREIRGSVELRGTHRDNGGLEGATVQATSNGHVVKEATTDRYGDYILEVPEGAQYTLKAMKADHDTCTRDGHSCKGSDTLDIGMLNGDVSGRDLYLYKVTTIGGTLRTTDPSASDGKVEMSVYRAEGDPTADDDGEGGWFDTVAVNGDYSIAVNEYGSYYVSATMLMMDEDGTYVPDPDFTATPENHHVELDAGDEVSRRDFTFGASGSISGKVVDSDGDVMEGVQVYVRKESAESATGDEYRTSGVTDRDGNYKITVGWGEYRVYVNNQDVATRSNNRYLFEPDERRVNVSEGDADKIVDDFVGHEASRISVGLVDPQASSGDREIVQLEFSGTEHVGDGEPSLNVVRAAEGRARWWLWVRSLDLDAGITVSISKAGSANAAEHFKPQSISLTSLAPNAYFGFFSKIEGTVTVGGSAAGGVEVTATPTGSTPGSAVTTYSDASGAYTLDVAHHGTYDVTGADAGYGFSTVTATVVRGRTSSGNDFGGMANPVYGTIEATVFMPDGTTAFEGLTTVMAEDANTGATYTLTESTPGVYSSNTVLAGNYEVTASASGYAFAPQTGTVVAGMTEMVTLTAAESAMISGEIMLGGTGLEGVTVMADYMSDGDVSNDPPDKMSNADGKYEFENLRFGEYTVTAMMDGYTITPITSITPIPPGHVVMVDGTNPDDTGNNFMAAEVPGTISGTVYIPAGAIPETGITHRGLPGVTITADDGDANTPNPTATSSADGTYTISGLAHGTYTIEATLTGHAFVDPDLEVTVGPPDMVNLTMQDFTQNDSWAATDVEVTRIEGVPDAAGTGVTADSVIVTWTSSTGPNAGNWERIRLTAHSSLLGSDVTVTLRGGAASGGAMAEHRGVVSNNTLTGVVNNTTLAADNLTVSDLRSGFTVAVESRLTGAPNAHWVPSEAVVLPAVDPTPTILTAEWVTTGGDMTITWAPGDVAAGNDYEKFRVQYKVPGGDWNLVGQEYYDPNGIPDGTARSATVEFGTISVGGVPLDLSNGLEVRVLARRIKEVGISGGGGNVWWLSAERRVPPR